jgi:hypothetical protein
MEDRWCNACGLKFTPRAQSPRQTYCALEECQSIRKQVWQQAKRRSDPDYFENQAKAQSTWAKKNPDYWRSYRASHPEYVKNNRANQRSRNGARQIAKSDASSLTERLPDGIYRLQLMGANHALGSVLVVQLSFLRDSAEQVR